MTTEMIDPEGIEEEILEIQEGQATDLSINEEELTKMFGGSQTTHEIVQGQRLLEKKLKEQPLEPEMTEVKKRMKYMNES